VLYNPGMDEGVQVLLPSYTSFNRPPYQPLRYLKVPSELYFACAAGLFLYQTLDNIDGKQVGR